MCEAGVVVPNEITKLDAARALGPHFRAQLRGASEFLR